LAEGSGVNEFSKDHLLRSWKEIAAYLGCDVRTCHRWEDQHGMPVHRANWGEKKSPVFAYRGELDKWFEETFTFSAKAKKGAGRPWMVWAVRAAILVAAGAVILVVLGNRARRQPADFAIEGSTFIALGKDKRELWRKDMNVDNLQDEAYYRTYFQVKHKDQSNILPALVIKDINADGDTEVLFALKRITDQTGEGILFCWDRQGKELWKFAAGRELACKAKIFSPDYRIAGFYPYDHNGDGKLEIVVESFQAPDWPCQLAMLDSSGKMTGEFWNAGYLRELTYYDINGDGREELIVCGVNNEYKGGCLIVFDPWKIAGGSPQTEDYVCKDIGPGTMLYYVTTPFTDVSRARGYRVEGFNLLDVSKRDWIRAVDGSGLIYEFDFSLRCIQVSFAHGYEGFHEAGVKAGKITSVIGEPYKKGFRDAVRYWTGAAWTAVPSPVRP
jgi:hypothetical protein